MKIYSAVVAALFLPAALWSQQPAPTAPAPPDAQQMDAQPGPPRPGFAGDGPRDPNPMNDREQGPEHFRGPGMEDGPGREHGFGHGDHEFGDERGPGEWWRNPMMAGRLGLSAGQTKRLEDLSLQSRLQAVQLRATLEEEELRLQPLLANAAVDQRAADAQIDKIAEARAALEKQEGHTMLSMRAVLTPEQWTKLHAPPAREGAGDARFERPGQRGTGQPPQNQ